MLLDDELQKILNSLAMRLVTVYGEKLKSVILYGSVARGTAAPDSDIDILLLVDASDDEIKAYKDKLDDISSDFDLEYIKVFSVVAAPYSEFLEWRDVLPYYQNVEKEGITLYAA